VGWLVGVPEVMTRAAPVKQCAYCGADFIPTQALDQAYCKPVHSKKAREKRNGTGRPTGSPRKVRNQVARLRERDGDDCWICLQPIDFTIADINDPMHYSRDHVIPHKRGGLRIVPNLKLAHVVCNVRRNLG
jgi:HNH endonuclease